MPFDDMVDTLVRHPSSSWVRGYAASAGLALISLVLATLGLALVISGDWHAGLCYAAIASWLYVLTDRIWRIAAGRRGWKAGIGYDTLMLDLPAGRSVMAEGERVRALLPFSEIDAIETRTESWNSFGVAHLQRAYAIRLKSGQLIRLGEDRALGASLADQTVGGMVDRLILRSGLRLRERPIAAIRNGLFGLSFVSTPPWPQPEGAGLPPPPHVSWHSLVTGLASLVTVAAAAALLWP